MSLHANDMQETQYEQHANPVHSYLFPLLLQTFLSLQQLLRLRLWVWLWQHCLGQSFSFMNKSSSCKSFLPRLRTSTELHATCRWCCWC